MNIRTITGLLLLVVLVGCRSGISDPNYEDQVPFDSGLSPIVGPDPYVEGEPRLSIGGFYEGGSSENIEINQENTHLYLYENTVALSFSGDRLEGLEADRLVHAGGDWWGMGVHWDSPRDLSAWGTMYISFQSTTFADIEIGMTGANDDRHVVLASAYGYVSDGKWHTLAIPLADFIRDGLNLPAVISPLNLTGPGGNAGDYALLDNVYFTTENVEANEAAAIGPPLPGPYPYQEGEQRLSIGGFYEGGSSENIEINQENTHLYLYENTVAIEVSNDRIEGLSSDRLVHGGGAWWGMGVHWNDTRDLSAWGTLYISFQSTTFADIEIGMTGANDDRHVVLASAYGYVNDGMWHTLAIPLADFVKDGLNLSAVSSPLNLTGPGGNAGDYALLDNVYFTTENAGVGVPSGDPMVDPFQAGEKRLSVGRFYEGGKSDSVEINGENTHLYLYENTVALEVSEDRLEGAISDGIVHGGNAWWGFGIHWDSTRDLSAFGTLYISLKSTTFTNIEIGMTGANDDRHVVLASAYGYVNDGMWHTLVIPLADFAGDGLNLSAVSSPFNLTGPGGSAGDVMLLDNVYFTDEGK